MFGTALLQVTLLLVYWPLEYCLLLKKLLLQSLLMNSREKGLRNMYPKRAPPISEGSLCTAFAQLPSQAASPSWGRERPLSCSLAGGKCFFQSIYVTIVTWHNVFFFRSARRQLPTTQSQKPDTVPLNCLQSLQQSKKEELQSKTTCTRSEKSKRAYFFSRFIILKVYEF